MSEPVSTQAGRQPDLLDEVVMALMRATGGTVAVRREDDPADETAPGRRLDMHLELVIRGQNVKFAIETLRNAYPRDISGAIWNLQGHLAARAVTKNGVIPLVAAHSLSPGAKELLRENGIAYFDLHGNLYLSFGRMLIDIQRPPTPSSTKKAAGTTDIFTDARACVVHALLTGRGKWLGVHPLATMATVSPGTCSAVMQELERREWCKSEGRGPGLRRMLTKPNALLDAWANAWKSRSDQRTRWYAFTSQPEALFKQLGQRLCKTMGNEPWAFTGTVPANIHAPYLTAVNDVDIIVPPGMGAKTGKGLRLERVEKGSNVTIVERGQAHLLFREKQPDGTWFASPFVLYLDLLNGRGRNQELADNLRQTLKLGTDGI